MAKKSAIVIVEDDEDDKILFKDIFTELGFKNQLKFFLTASEALSYLESTEQKSFLILCDINLPGTDGIAFKKAINDNEALRNKAIPFIFYTGSADKYSIRKAFFEATVQGYFVKEQSYAKVKSNIKTIVDYWSASKHPDAD